MPYFSTIVLHIMLEKANDDKERKRILVVIDKILKDQSKKTIII